MPAPVIINLDLANAEIIRDGDDGQSTSETRSERESICRPCVHCKDDFYEFNDEGGRQNTLSGLLVPKLNSVISLPVKSG